MKFVVIADTHGKHADLKLPPGDILIHAGDVSMKGDEATVIDFLKWFDDQNFAHKIFIAGNHDFYLERETSDAIKKIIPPGVTYLNDSGITINGISIWGSPVTPWFLNWAFNRHPGEAIQQHWELIPNDTNILITHGPVFRILDKMKSGKNVGCKDLFEKVNELKPNFHIFGHIHESYGIIEQSGTKFINASVVNEEYEVNNEPIVFEFSVG